MKKLILFILLATLISCSDDKVTISKAEYNKLKGITNGISEYPKEYKFTEGDKVAQYRIWDIVLAADGHEYLENNGGNAYICMHYVDCKLCYNRVAKKDSIKK